MKQLKEGFGHLCDIAKSSSLLISFNLELLPCRPNCLALLSSKSEKTHAGLLLPYANSLIEADTSPMC